MKIKTPLILRTLVALFAFGAVTALKAEEGAKKQLSAAQKKYDVNNDGVLDEKEKAQLEADKAKKKADSEAKRLEKYDKNKNGKLDADELEAEKADHAAKRAEKEKKKSDSK